MVQSKKPRRFTIAACRLALGIGRQHPILRVNGSAAQAARRNPDADRIVQVFLLTLARRTRPPARRFEISKSGQQQTTPFKVRLARRTTSPVRDSTLTANRPEQVTACTVTEAISASSARRSMLGPHLHTAGRRARWRQGGLVLSYAVAAQIWRRSEYRRQSALHGQRAYTIIGVLGNQFLRPEADHWLPFQSSNPHSTNQGHFFLAAGMLQRPGISLPRPTRR